MNTPITAAELAAARELYEAGLYQQAYVRAREIGPFHAWRGPDARVLAGRLAYNLGAPRLGRMCHLRGWREDRSHPEAEYYYARALLERRGPLASWRFAARNEDLAGAGDVIRADWHALRATTAGILRDFDTAERLLARAEALAPTRAWIWVERAHVLEQQDKYNEALASARKSLELSPWYRPAVQSAAHVLYLLDRVDEAIELLQQAARRSEVGPIHAQLAGFLEERGPLR